MLGYAALTRRLVFMLRLKFTYKVFRLLAVMLLMSLTVVYFNTEVL